MPRNEQRENVIGNTWVSKNGAVDTPEPTIRVLMARRVSNHQWECARIRRPTGSQTLVQTLVPSLHMISVTI